MLPLIDLRTVTANLNSSPRRRPPDGGVWFCNPWINLSRFPRTPQE